MQFNRISVESVIDCVGRTRPTEQFLTTQDADWLPHRSLLDEDGLLVMAAGGFLVRGIGDRLLLVDAGLGGLPPVGIFEQFGTERRLLQSLAALGVAPEDITDVLFTHLHADHIGWSTKAGQIVFPNADYWCDQAEWAHFVGPDPGTTKKLTPIADRVRTWSSDGPILPGLDVIRAPGHTPGSTILVLSSGSARAMLLGDVVHCPVELLESEWQGIGDVDPALALRTRERMAREIEGADVSVAGTHFPEMAFGRLLRGEGGRSWVFD